VEARRGVHLLRDQYSPITVALGRADIFRDELAAMNVEPATLQIALAHGPVDELGQTL
jgi:hypothetical protein